MPRSLRSIAGVRLAIAIQVFTTLLILVVGYFVVERNLRDLANSPKPVSPFQIKMALLAMRSEVLGVAFVAFLSGVALTITIRREIRALSDQLRKLSSGIVESPPSREPSWEFIPLDSAIKDLAEAVGNLFQKTVTDAVILLDQNKSIDSVNAAAEVLLGYKEEELKGKPIEALFPKTRENDGLYKWLKDEHGEVSRSENLPLAVVMNRKGDWMTVRIGFFQMKTAHGVLKGLMIGAFDEVEWRRIRNEFERAEKLSSLGALARGLAHEIKNPLGSIQGLVQLLLEDFPDDHKKRAYLETVLEETRRLDEIMKRLLDLSPTSPWRKEPVNLGKLLQDVALLMSGEASRRGVVLESPPTREDANIVGDPHRLRQAFINVIKNAIEATVRGGVVRCSLGRIPSGWTVEVENTLGIAEAQSPNQDAGVEREVKVGGSGLGVLITQQIMQHHDGYLDIQGPSNGRLVVRMVFPLRDEAKTDSLWREKA
jgi:PAS domain S-box-containing protein